MAWTLRHHAPTRDATGVVGVAWDAWVDQPQAAGWLAALRAALDAGVPQQVTADNLPAAAQSVLDLWTALSGFLRAIDLPAASFPEYALGITAREGAAGGMLGPTVGSQTADADAVLAAHDPPYATDGGDVILCYRVWLRVDAAPAVAATLGDPAWLLATTPPAPPGHTADATFDEWEATGACGPTLAEANLWWCAIWSRWTPGALGAGGGVWTYLIPLQRSWDFGATMARAILRDGIDGTLDRSRAYVALQERAHRRGGGRRAAGPADGGACGRGGAARAPRRT